MSAPIRVLYVDDYPLDRELVRDALERESSGFALTEAASRQEFEARLAEGAYDVVLSDFNILGFDGLAVLDAVRAVDTRMPVVIVTGTGSEEVAAEAIKRGATDYVIKSPGHIRRLPQTIHAALDKLQQQEKRLLAEEALRESDEKFRYLFFNNPQPMWVYDLETLAFLEVNDAAVVKYGYSRDEFLRMGIAEIRPPEDVARLLEHLKKDRPEIRSSGAWRHRCKDGALIDVEITSHTLEFIGRQAALIVVQDVTRRKQAEESLRLQSAALAAAADAIVITDRAGDIRWVNPAFTRLIGYSAAEVIGQNPRLLKSGSHDTAFYKSLWDTILAGETWRGEIVNRRKDGSLYTEEESITPVRDAGGIITHFVAIKQDITERKRVETAEREQRALAEALRETAAALASTLSFDEVLDRILVEVGRVVPHDAARVMLVEDGIANTVRTYGYEEQAPGLSLHPLRLPVTTTSNLLIVTQTGQPLAISDTRNFIGWTDSPQTRWVRSNATAPIKIKEEIIGFLGLESATPSFFTTAHAERLQAFADQAAVAIENARLYDEISRYAAELEQRVAARTAELTQREAALQVANQQLQQLSRIKSEFVSNVSHELRTPLSNIKTYLWLLERGKPEKHAKYMETLHRESELLQRLIEDLLHLSRLDLGKVQPVMAPVDVNEVVTLLAGDRAVMFADHGLTLDTQIEPGLPPVHADEKMLIQILTNLMTNAMNYTPRGGAVMVKTGLQIADCRLPISDAAPNLQSQIANPQSSWVTFSVSDTGPGISAEDQARLFERFFRGDAARQTNTPGTGLGLAICQELIERHRGKLTLVSQVGAGSTFTVWLPIA